jgi:glycosyltransferase involved in cell wall biosynthesis
MEANEPLQLCVAAQNFYPVPGGAVLRFLRYFPGLQQRGAVIRVVTGTPRRSQVAPTEIVQQWAAYPVGAIIPTEPLNGARIHRVRLPARKGLRRLYILNREVYRVCREPGYQPDVVQLISSLPHRSLLYSGPLRRRGTAVVFAYTITLNQPLNPVRRLMRRWLLKALSRQLDCVIVNASSMRAQAQAMGFDTRIEVITNGVDLKRFSPWHKEEARCSLRRTLGIGAEAPMLLSVGSLSARKGVDLAIEAWQRIRTRFPETHLVLAGAGFDTTVDDPQKLMFARRLQELSMVSGAAHHLHFTGYVDRVEDYYRAADIFVFPSEKEGLPNAVLEAMACGLPVVLTPFESLSEDIGKPARDFDVSDRNPAALAAVLETLLQNPERRWEMGKSARRWIESTMDMEHTLDRYMALYRELSAERRRAVHARLHPKPD